MFRKKQIKNIEECYIEEISLQEFEMNLQIHLQVDFFNSAVIKVHHFVYYSSFYIFKQCKINIEEIDSKISYLELATIIYCRICIILKSATSTYREICNSIDHKTGKQRVLNIIPYMHVFQRAHLLRYEMIRHKNA